jgi:hypothetical protein
MAILKNIKSNQSWQDNFEQGTLADYLNQHLLEAFIKICMAPTFSPILFLG